MDQAVTPSPKSPIQPPARVSKFIAWRYILLLLLFLLIGLGTGWFLGTTQLTRQNTLSMAPSIYSQTAISPTPMITITASPSQVSLKTYTGNATGLQFQYPANWFVSTTSVDAGRQTMITVSAEQQGHTGDINDRTAIIAINADDPATDHLAGHTYQPINIGNQPCETDDFPGRGGLGYANKYLQCKAAGKLYTIRLFTHNEDYTLLNRILNSIQFTQ